MAKYCDPKILKNVWLSFILASKVPALEPLRCSGVLFTLNIGDGVLEHCVASVEPYKFISISGKVQPSDLSLSFRSACFPLDILMTRELTERNYLFEKPISISWNVLSILVYKTCCGVALNFHLPEDAKNELIHEALILTLLKMRRGKLIFDPKRSSPPFNLLTTAIFRIMYSIKNKEKREREHRSDLVDAMMSGVDLPDFSSIRVSKSLITNGTSKT